MDERKERGPGDETASQGPKTARQGASQKQSNHAARARTATPLFSAGNVGPLLRADLPLIPLHEWNAVDKKGRDRGKSPLHGAWQARQYDSERVVEDASRRGLNIGVRLTSEWLVLDVDPRNFPEGRDVLAEFARNFALDLSACPHTLTGSGGHHYWFRKPVDVATVDSLEGYDGIEFESAGRQVVAPGSVHPNGRRYEWDDLAPDIAEAPPVPEHLLDRILRPERKSSSGGAGELTPERLARSLEPLDPCDFREHDAWLELMMSCHHATDGEGRQEFIDWSTGDPSYADDGWIIGQRWDSLHSGGMGGVTIRTLVKRLAERGQYLAPPDAAEDFDEWVDDEPLAKSRSRWALLRPSEIKSLPPPRWLIQDLLPEAVPAVIYGPPASGKSFLALDLALCVALGRPWQGRKVQRGNVMYIAAEGARGAGKRLQAWELHHGTEVSDDSFAWMCSELSLADPKQAAEFTEFVVANAGGGLALIVVDTLSQTAGGAEEQDNSDMAAYMKRVQGLVNATGATTVVVHHSGKDLSKGERGALAIRGNVDTSIEVTRPDRGTLVLTTKKQKDADEGDPVRLTLMQVQFAGPDGEPLSSLVIEPALVVTPAPTDFSEFEDGVTGILGLAREMAAGSGRLKVSELVAAAMSRLGLSESAARREAKQIPEGRIDAVAAGDVWLWCERGGKHATAPLIVRSELRK